MPTRLQPSEEWQSKFVRGLPGQYKALWFWLKSACDMAGVWEIDMELARLVTGFPELEQTEAESLFKVKIIVLDCGEKWFLNEFLSTQFKTTTLNPVNTYHRGAIKILDKVKLLDLEYNILTEQLKAPLKGLRSSFKATKDKDMVMDKVNSKEDILLTREENLKPYAEKENKTEKSKTKSVPKETVKTYDTPLVQAFRDFKEMRVKKRAPLTPRAAELIHMELKKLAGENEELKIKILEQSIKKSWSDVFPLKDNNNYTQATGKSKTDNVIDIATAATYQQPIEA